MDSSLESQVELTDFFFRNDVEQTPAE